MKVIRFFTAEKKDIYTDKIERIYFKVDNNADLNSINVLQKEYDKGMFYDYRKKPVRVFKKYLPKDVNIKTFDDYLEF